MKNYFKKTHNYTFTRYRSTGSLRCSLVFCTADNTGHIYPNAINAKGLIPFELLWEKIEQEFTYHEGSPNLISNYNCQSSIDHFKKTSTFCTRKKR